MAAAAPSPASGGAQPAPADAAKELEQKLAAVDADPNLDPGQKENFKAALRREAEQKRKR